MTPLELLAPARNADIGIAAIDSGADAVYIAGPYFGARKDAGNSVEEIARLCGYAHRFGARIFVTVNISVSDEELPELHRQMLLEQAAGVDAFIIRDERICSWDDITVPLHASTQCAIRTPEDARRYEALGCSRLVLERELPLETIKAIRKAVSCELEVFVHGALCVCYSGECSLSAYLDGRSADRGECIQACRSLYDLVDSNGKVLVRNKALLSLKDLNLHERLSELADAGVCSFKIEGRLKSISYVRNITRWYSQALGDIAAGRPDDFRRASYGIVSGGFSPDPWKTFNRGYTELFLDGKRGQWSSMDAPTNLGTPVGTVSRIRHTRSGMEISIAPERGRGVVLGNGDGFAFIHRNSIVGFRGDVCEGLTITCKAVEGLREGTRLYRNIDAAFGRELEKNLPKREIPVSLEVKVSGKWNIEITATSQDGRRVVSPFKADVETAENRMRAADMFREQLSKRSGHYIFSLDRLEAGELPLLSASILNSMRRLVAEDLDSMTCNSVPMMNSAARTSLSGATCHSESTCHSERSEESSTPAANAVREPLMRSKYCIRYELGMCPVHQGAADSGPLFLLNNGRRLALGFDCKACEMTVSAKSL